MSELVTISLNEFRALMRKAFEGIYGHNHDWDAIAGTVLWLEYHGLNGLDIFLDAEEELSSAKTFSPETSVGDQIKIDAKGISLLALNELICDLAIDQAESSEICIVNLVNTKNFEVIVASVARCQRYGFAAAAWWPGGNDWARIAVQDIGEDKPFFGRIELPKGYEFQGELTLIVSKSLEMIESQFPQWFGFRKDGSVSANEVAETYYSYLDTGFTLSRLKYDRLCHCADRVLVEATEASRKGAGE